MFRYGNFWQTIQNIFALRYVNGLTQKNKVVELYAFDFNDLIFKLES